MATFDVDPCLTDVHVVKMVTFDVDPCLTEVT